MKDSKQITAIKEAYNKGYRVQADGSVLSPTGIVRKLTYQKNENRNPYLKFNIKLSIAGWSITYPVSVHKLAAYQKYGEAYLADGQVARHLDGDPHNNSLDNIVIGSISENSLDIPEHKRKALAKKAGSINRRFTDEEVAAIRKDHASGLGYKKLEKKWNTSRSTLSYFLSKTGKKKAEY
jgi:hypothetical protein